MRPANFSAKNIGTATLEKALWWRVHSNAYHPNAFNGSPNGSARFSPIKDAAGAVIPTMYLGNTPAVALMETVLHDAPFPASGFILTLPAIDVRRAACLVNINSLLVADFSSIGLRRLGLKKADVIDSEKADYPITQAIAEKVYEQCPDVQGIKWTSRQDDSGVALVLFGPRIKPNQLCVWHRDEPINDGMIFDELLQLLDRLDAGLITG